MLKNLALLALAGAANAASITDIKHVVMLMMENRAFNHYFGTMSGIRGFADPNVLVNDDGVSVWYQNVSGITNETDYLLPYYLNYLGGEEVYNKSQCLCAGENNWIPTHEAMNNGRMDMWAQIDTPQSWGYLKRKDIPFHFAIAESYTVGDAYYSSIASNTDSNRLFWQSGTINVPGGPQPLGSGGVLLDDTNTNGCEGTDLDCLPYYWPAYAQYMEDAGVDWKCFQDSYHYANTNQLFHFAAFQNASTNSSMYQRGLLFDGVNGLDGFKARAANGTLPMISYIFAPNILHEHSPYAPNDGAWFINQVIGSVINGTGYNDTVVLLNYDEGGGWGDSVPPIIPPNGTAGEWFQDPYDVLGYTYAGTGPRVPLAIISPFTRGGHVFTERSDHSSIIQFLETYLTAHGYQDVNTTQMDDWRRDHMSDLINAFDFENPDYSIPELPQPKMPITNDEGEIIGMYVGFCEIEWPVTCSTSEYISGIPYGQQTEENSLQYEDGYKGVRGYLTEGHYLVFEANGYALSRSEGLVEIPDASSATSNHSSITQRWVLHAQTEEGTTFTLSSAVDGLYISTAILLTSYESDAEVFDIVYAGSSQYTIQATSDNLYLGIDSLGSLQPSTTATYYDVYSVTYHS